MRLIGPDKNVRPTAGFVMKPHVYLTSLLAGAIAMCAVPAGERPASAA